MMESARVYHLSKLPNATGSFRVTFPDDWAARNVSNQNAKEIAVAFANGSINVTIPGRVKTPSVQGLRNA